MKLKLVLAALCLAVAAVALALARDVWLWEKAIRDADRRAQFARTVPASWEAATVLPGDPGRSAARDRRRPRVPPPLRPRLGARGGVVERDHLAALARWRRISHG